MSNSEITIDVDSSGGFYVTSTSIKDSAHFKVQTSDCHKYILVIPAEENDDKSTICATDDGELYVPYKLVPETHSASKFYWQEESESGFSLTPNIIGVGKGCFATTDVYLWKGDIDAEGESISYSQLVNDPQFHLEDGLDYCIPYDADTGRGNPFESRTLDQFVLDSYGETNDEEPLLVQVWFRRYASLETEDQWDTFSCTDYGEAPWGCEEYLVYKNQILSSDIRKELSQHIIFPYV